MNEPPVIFCFGISLQTNFLPQNLNFGSIKLYFIVFHNNSSFPYGPGADTDSLGKMASSGEASWPPATRRDGYAGADGNVITEADETPSPHRAVQQ